MFAWIGDRERFNRGHEEVTFRVDLDDEDQRAKYLLCDLVIDWTEDRGYVRDANGDGLPPTFEDEREVVCIREFDERDQLLAIHFAKQAYQAWPEICRYLEHIPFDELVD